MRSLADQSDSLYIYHENKTLKLPGFSRRMHHEGRSPRRPRKTNMWPDKGCCSSTVWAWALSQWKPRRMSVTPAAIQIRVLPEARSRTKTHEHHADNRRIDAAFEADTNLTWQFYMNRAGTR